MSNLEKGRKAHLIGGGIAGLAAAAYLIKDGGLLGANITVYEEGGVLGGCLDAGSTAEKGYSMRGERMFEPNYVCTYDLLSFIPSLDDPTKSIKQDIFEFVDVFHWNNKARLVDKNGKITNFHDFGFNEHDRLDIIELTSKPERVFDDKRITDCFEDHFFKTNFWYMWQSTFGFEPWHSAIEMRRYMLRFMHLFSCMPTQSGLYRTRYNQYDSMIRPMKKWLGDQGVKFVAKTRVTDIDIGTDPDQITATRILMIQDGKAKEVEVAPDDIVLATIGSMVADTSLGSNTSAPELITTKKDGAFALWETLARGRKDLGNPSVFSNHIDEAKWESFTVTSKDPRFYERIEEFTGNDAGRNGMITLKDSSWLLTISTYRQPQYVGQPKDVSVWWGYGLYPDKIGDYVHKPMSQCSGAEILEETLRQLKWDADLKRIRDSAITIPCMMPYITSMFLKRKTGDRPSVVPKGSTNFGLLGQFVEVPEDTVFTVEYSVRTAQIAVFKLLKLAKEPNPFPRVCRDVRVLWNAMQAMHQTEPHAA
jgi:oleate hydratase